MQEIIGQLNFDRARKDYVEAARVMTDRIVAALKNGQKGLLTPFKAEWQELDDLSNARNRLCEQLLISIGEDIGSPAEKAVQNQILERLTCPELLIDILLCGLCGSLRQKKSSCKRKELSSAEPKQCNKKKQARQSPTWSVKDGKEWSSSWTQEEIKKIGHYIQLEGLVNVKQRPTKVQTYKEEDTKLWPNINTEQKKALVEGTGKITSVCGEISQKKKKYWSCCLEISGNEVSVNIPYSWLRQRKLHENVTCIIDYVAADACEKASGKKIQVVKWIGFPKYDFIYVE